jgi:hypothetical protein
MKERMPSDPRPQTLKFIRLIEQEKKKMQISSAMEKWKGLRKIEEEEGATVTTS